MTGLNFILIPAPDEELTRDVKIQMEAGIWREVELEIVPLRQDSHDAGKATLAASLWEEGLSLAQMAGPPLLAALATWITTRAGRKVKIKVGEVEIEASSAKEIKDLTEEIEVLLERAERLKEAKERKRPDGQ